MKVTINDVAEAAGVSISTVSKVMHDSYSISAETKKKVLDVVSELGYVPSRRAQNFANKSNKSVLVLADMHKDFAYNNQHFFEIIVGLEAELSKNSYELILKHISAKDLSRNFAEISSDDSYTGFVIHASCMSYALAENLANHDFPYVIIGDPSISGYKKKLSWIDVNNYYASEIALEHLKSMHYENIAFLAAKDTDQISNHRLEAYLSNYEHKDKEDLVFRSENNSDAAYAETINILKSPLNVDAIICANQILGFGALDALKINHVEVPLDMGLITFDDYPISQIVSPDLSIVNLDMFELGEEVAKTVIKKIKEPKLLVQYNLTLPQLIVRSSSRRLNKYP